MRQLQLSFDVSFPNNPPQTPRQNRDSAKPRRHPQKRVEGGQLTGHAGCHAASSKLRVGVVIGSSWESMLGCQCHSHEAKLAWCAHQLNCCHVSTAQLRCVHLFTCREGGEEHHYGCRCETLGGKNTSKEEGSGRSRATETWWAVCLPHHSVSYISKRNTGAGWRLCRAHKLSRHGTAAMPANALLNSCHLQYVPHLLQGVQAPTYRRKTWKTSLFSLKWTHHTRDAKYYPGYHRVHVGRCSNKAREEESSGNGTDFNNMSEKQAAWFSSCRSLLKSKSKAH